MFEELKSTCQDIGRSMGNRLFGAATRGRVPTLNELITEDVGADPQDENPSAYIPRC